VLEQAKSFASTGMLDEARQEYKRWLYFADKPEQTGAVWFQLGQLEEKAQAWEAARKAYERALQTAADDSLRHEAIYRFGLLSVHQQKYAEAHFYLQPLTFIPPDEGLQPKMVWLDVLCLNGIEAFDQAHALARNLYVDHPEVLKQIDSAYAVAYHQKYLNPERAQWLSIIPSIGLLYAGSYKDALVSGALVGGFFGIAIYAAFNQHYIFAVLSGLLLSQKFYEGGARLAGRLIEQENAERRYMQRMQLQKLLLDQPPSGLK